MRTSIYGLVAEFDTPAEIVAAARKALQEGYRKMDAYSPFPVEGLSEAVGFHKDNVALICLVGGILGLATAYAMQYWISVIAYPVNVAGRPLHSWPAFIVVCFEMTILFGGLAAAIGMLGLNGLPAPYHSVFNNPRFSSVTRDRFFLCVEAADPQFDVVRTQEFMQSLKPLSISEVPH